MFKKILCKKGKLGHMLYHKYPSDAGWDLLLPADYEYNFYDREPIIDFGVHVKIPRGYCALLCPRSSFTLAGGQLALGVIDAEYTGSIKGKFYRIPQEYKAGDRVAQLVFLKCAGLPIHLVTELQSQGRGLNGFGSTGK